ncbi:MAG: hypothetical protein MMC33_002211 [Icmadophila ericetorum]|nr:hypothetical protein [Icmadophila ericetorum]
MLARDAFQDFHDVPAPPPPAPAPGPALLDDHETGMLDDFFEKINTGQLDNNAFLVDDAGQVKNNLNWNPWTLDDLPPLFHGSTSSLAPLDTHSGLSLQKNQNLDYLQDFSQIPAYNPGRVQSSNTSPEVLAAASTLLQNSQNGYHGGRSSNTGTSVRHNSTASNQPISRPYSNHSENPYAPVPMSSFLHSTRDHRSSISHPPRQLDPSVMSGENVLRDMYFGARGPSSGLANPRPVSRSKLLDPRWGSDASFFDGGFVPPPNQETEEEITGTLMSRMEGFEPQTSANTTQPSSPMMSRPSRRIGSQDGLNSVTNRPQNPRTQAPRKHGSMDFYDSRPRKRQKGKLKSEFDDDDDGDDAGAEPDEDDDPDDNDNSAHRPLSSHQSRGRPRASTRNSSMKITKDTPSKRRSSPSDRGKRRPSTSGPSGGDEPKSKTGGRDNLTEEQKRNNHILSEQKRRNLIRQGFEELCELVPDLKGGGFSKSAMLSQAAEWLESLIQGNEKLRGVLEDLKEQQGI